MKQLKLILYWITLIPPVVDMVKGAIAGLKLGLQDIRDKHEKGKWDQAN
ncbi:MAG: hypothetical protein [Microvirus sp.]|nr:MAG: hypothetical protein [Microvirus sp.]